MPVRLGDAIERARLEGFAPLLSVACNAGGASSDGAGTAGNGRRLRLAARCPRCGKPPALLVTGRLAALVRDCPPDEVVADYRCARLRCGTVFDLRAGAFHDAA